MLFRLLFLGAEHRRDLPARLPSFFRLQIPNREKKGEIAKHRQGTSIKLDSKGYDLALKRFLEQGRCPQ